MGWGESQANTLEEAIFNNTTCMAWVYSTILAPSASTCSESLVMYVGAIASTNYRNVYLEGPSVPFGFSNSRMSKMAEIPDVVVPISEAPYNSTITGHLEHLSGTADLMMAKGCDGMLFSLIEDLHETGILKTILSGVVRLREGK